MTTGSVRRQILSSVSFLVLVGTLASRAETIDPADDGSQYAWGENTGWLNAEPLGDGGPGVRVLEDRLDGWIWSETLGWISLSCGNTRSCSTVEFGVTNDGTGDLSGYGWSESSGWISVSCENTDSCTAVDYGVSIDPGTGEFDGWAWSENMGWISFSCANTGSCLSVEYGIVTEIPFLRVAVFGDDFESGDLSNWSNSVP